MSSLYLKDKYNKVRKKARDRFKEEVQLYKAASGCKVCGEQDPICLELHHLDPTIKDINPSSATSRKMFYEEADKCIVLCSNCHRKEHKRLRLSGILEPTGETYARLTDGERWRISDSLPR